jgi:hypothetical protein
MARDHLNIMLCRLPTYAGNAGVTCRLVTPLVVHTVWPCTRPSQLQYFPKSLQQQPEALSWSPLQGLQTPVSMPIPVFDTFLARIRR